MVTDGTASENTGEKLYTVTTASETDNGEYKCSGDYSGTAVESAGLTLHVRALPENSDIYVPLTKSSTEISCTVYGDETSEFKWYDDSTVIADNTIVTDVTPDYTGKYNSNTFSNTIKLTFANAAIAQEKTYTCKATWSDDEKPSIASTYTVDILSKWNDMILK